MRLLTDPPELPPEVIWRTLLPLRPQRRTDYRIRGAEQTPLIIKAVPAMVEAMAWDSGSFLYPSDGLGSTTELRDRAGAMAIVSEALWTPQGRAFPTVSDMGELSDDELRDLAGEVFRTFADICPSHGRSDGAVWAAVLEEGARHHTNHGEAMVLACSIDLVYGGGRIPRPDRYWGVPLNQLLDGHWLLYQSASALLKDKK